MTHVLILGSGAREHALAWRLSSESDTQIFCASGNAGTERVAKNLSLDALNFQEVLSAVSKHKIDFVIVGTEVPLVAGITDALRDQGIAVFGPSKAAAQLEGSKAFSKLFMRRHAIPTAAFEIFEDAEKAKAYARAANRALVVKADGLAAGKGVVVAANADEACAAVDLIMLARAFGDAGQRVVIEECMLGEEVSYHVLSDGKNFVPLAPAQDHKRVFDGDRGPNTGGMGVYSPPPVVDAAMEKKILERVVTPTLEGMAKEGMPFLGALFVGLMIVDQEPLVLEYNVRFGDPECEAIIARWGGPLLPVLLDSARGKLTGVKPRWHAPASLSVVLAAQGYPGDFAKGTLITGIDRAERIPNVQVFHAGTRRDQDKILTNGGRVLTVTAHGSSIDEAAARAYEAADIIQFEGKHFRRDVGWRARTQR